VKLTVICNTTPKGEKKEAENFMEIKFNIEKTKRKELAHSIAEIIECDCK